MSFRRERLSRNFSGYDLIFGAAISAYLGFSIAENPPVGFDFVWLGGGLFMLAIAISGVQDEIIFASEKLGSVASFIWSISAFFFAWLNLKNLSPNPQIPATIIGVWALIYTIVFAGQIRRGNKRDD